MTSFRNLLLLSLSLSISCFENVQEGDKNNNPMTPMQTMMETDSPMVKKPIGYRPERIRQ